MKTLLFTLLVWGVSITWALADGCQSYPVMRGNKIIMCTQCCWNGVCSVNCQ